MLVTANYGSPQWVTYDLSNLGGACDGPVARWETNTDGLGNKYEHFEEGAEISDQSIALYFDANTVQTMEVKCPRPPMRL